MAARVSKDQFEELVLKSELPVLLDFYSDSCVPCKKINGPLGDIEDDNEGKIKVLKVNTNYEEELTSEYGIESVPTLVLIKDGAEVARSVGALSYDKIDELIAEHI